MDIIFDLATPNDDPAIRQLLARNPVPGPVTVSYEREPNYFLGCEVMGPFSQVFVGRHQPDGRLTGVACRAIRRMFVNGRAEAVGYLGQLRVDRPFQGRWLVSAGFRFFHQLLTDGQAKGYITTIIEGNTKAEGVLIRRLRPNFPYYRPLDRLCTAAILLRRPQKIGASEYEIRSGSPQNLGQIVAFLNQHGPSKQFYPYFEEADFCNRPTTRDFQVEDFLLAYRQGHLVGVLGLWDQSGYKQTIVRAYDASLRRLRPFYNIGGRLLGLKPMPPPGQPIHFAYASFICLANNDPAIFRVLLHRAYNLASERGYAYLMVGLSERDPLLAEVRRYWHIPYYSRLYTVGWQEDLSFHEKLDGRLPYVEIAAL